MKHIYRKVLLRIFESRLFRWVMLSVVPYIRFTCYYTSFRGWKYQRGYAKLRPGHIILTNDRWKLTSILIPGEWSHAALCVGKKCDDSEIASIQTEYIHPSPLWVSLQTGEFEVAEMTHTHYTQSTFFDLCKEASRVGIYECTDWDNDYVPIVIRMCLNLRNKRYGLDAGPVFLHCSEMIPESDPQHRLKVSDEDILGLGIPYVSPTGLSKASNIRKVWDSDDEIEPCWERR